MAATECLRPNWFKVEPLHMPITINTAQPRPPHKEPLARAQNKWFTLLIEAGIIVLVVLVMVVVRLKIYSVAIPISRSMEPTLRVGDRILYDHRDSLHDKWQRGDIVFFEPPASWEDAEGDLLVKRLVALPGETIAVRSGHVYVDNQELKTGTVEEEDDSFSPLTLGADEYFVLGDNRSNSDDSRRRGPIKGSNIRGRAAYRLWPSPGSFPAWP